MEQLQINVADRKGRRFYAIVIARCELEVEPIDRRVTYRRVKAREVLGIWRKSRATSARNVEGDQAGGMSQQANGNGRAGESVARLVVVRVEDTIEPELARHTGGSYESPPQTHEQATALVRLLLGRAAADRDGERQWTASIAGGRRVVTLTEERKR